MPTQHVLITAEAAERIKLRKVEILSMADSLLSQLDTIPLNDPENPGVQALREYCTAICMAEALMTEHDSESQADELPFIYAESLMLWHLRELAMLLELPLDN